MTKFHRRGVRWSNNTLLLLFIFFIVGLFLHYSGRPQPVLKLWEDVKSIFTTSSSGGRDTPNPYRSPEPDQPDSATDSRKLQKSLPNFDGSSEGETTSGAGLSGELARIMRQRDFVLPALDGNDQVVRHTGYTLKYVERYEQAAWVAYELPGTQVKGNQERENTFYDDPSVKSGSAVHADYTRSGYDRGHLAPAADFKNNRVMMKESFYMSNISPQAPDFNRGIWSDLEQLVRVWAIRYKKVYIVTGPVLKPGLPTIGRLNKVAVPEQYYKVILAATPQGEVKGIAFLMRNEGSREPLSSFVVPIDKVEQVTGIDFFPRLPDTIEDQVESHSTPSDWYRLK